MIKGHRVKQKPELKVQKFLHIEAERQSNSDEVKSPNLWWEKHGGISS